MKKTFLFFIFSIYSAIGCEIVSAPKIYYGVKTDQSVNFYQKSTCSSNINKYFNKILSSSEGSVSASHIESILKERYKKDISVRPKKLSTISIEAALKKELSLAKNWTLSDLILQNKNHILLLNEFESISFNCGNCTSLGKKDIQARIVNEKNGLTKIIWINANTNVTVNALVATKHMRPGSIDATTKFKASYIPSDTPEKLFTNTKKLPYYRLNKPLKEGQPLKYSDLSPINIVRRSRPVQVILSRKNLSLNGSAIPMSSGKFGDTIQLKNPKTGRTLVGKIIDHNKVKVEL